MTDLLDILYRALSVPITIWGYTFDMFGVWVFCAIASLIVWFLNNFRGGE